MLSLAGTTRRRVSVNTAGTRPTTTAAIDEQAERLPPAERAPGDVGAERGTAAAADERQAQRDGHQQHADVGHRERQGVAVLEHGQARRTR